MIYSAKFTYNIFQYFHSSLVWSIYYKTQYHSKAYLYTTTKVKKSILRDEGDTNTIYNLIWD